MFHVTSEAEAKKDAEERVQRDETMEPQDAHKECEHPEPKENKLEREVSESAEISRPQDASAGEPDQGGQPRKPAHQNPSLQNGTSF